MHYVYETKNTCSRLISLDIEGDVVTNVQFLGGCHGNLQAIPRLVDGWTVEEIASKLEGIHCGNKQTSCGDQLAHAVREAYEEQKKQQEA